MMDKSSLWGRSPQDPRLKNIPDDEIAGDDAMDEHPHGADHISNSQMFFVKLALAAGGHIDSLENPYSQENQEEVEDEKLDDFYHLMHSMILRQIENLEFRNEYLEKLLTETKTALLHATEAREKIIPQIETARQKLTICGRERDQTLKTLEEAERIQKEAQNLTLDAQNAFPSDAIKNVAQVTFVLNNNDDRPRVAEVKVPVYMKNGKYFFIDPLTEEPQEITGEDQKKELQEQLQKGIKTYDALPGEIEHRTEHYNKAASSFIWYALEADRKRALLEKAEQEVEKKKTEYAEDKQNLEDLTTRLAATDREIEELKEKMAAYGKEIEENKTRIAALEENKTRLETLYAEREKLRDGTGEAKEKLFQNGRELSALAEKTLDATQEYYSSVKAHDDYSDKTQQVWQIVQEYRKSTAALREKGVSFSEETRHDPKNPESHIHLLHVTNREEFGQDPETLQAIDSHGRIQEQLHKTLHEYYALSEKTEEFEDIDQKPLPASAATSGRASVDTKDFGNERPLTGHITPVFTDAAGTLPQPGEQPAPNPDLGKPSKNAPVQI
ncbi:MAG: hypothetical protein WBK55_02130 [Alphaproteobacteria bacterium]